MPERKSLVATNTGGFFGSVYLAFTTFSNFFVGWLLEKAGLYGINIPLSLGTGQSKPKDDKPAIVETQDAVIDEVATIRVKVVGASCLPKMDISGAADPYVVISCGAKERKTKVVKDSLQPHFGEEFVFESRKDSKETFKFVMMDQDSVGSDEFIGRVAIPVEEILKEKNGICREFELVKHDGKPVKNSQGQLSVLSLEISFVFDGTSSEADWLNSALAKVFRAFQADVDDMVKAQLTDTFQNLGLPVITLELSSFSIGQSAPWLMRLELLPSRSDKDIQLRCRLRWVADGHMGIKILAKAGPISVSASVANLEIEFPAWIQLRLQSEGEPLLTAFQLAATDQPTVKFTLSLGGMDLATIPGIEEAIDFGIRKALTGLLVLPNKISNITLPMELNLPAEQANAVGRLSVKLFEASGLKATGPEFLGSTCDPFAVISFKGKKSKTKTIEKCTTPVWNEFAQFFIASEESDFLEIEVFDAGPLSSDTLGSIKITVADVAKNKGWREGWYDLQGSQTGKLRIALEYARYVPDDGPKESVAELEPGSAKLEDDVDPASETQARALPKDIEIQDVVGQLSVRVVSATNLPKVDMVGSCDGYIVVSNTKQKKRTRVVKDNLNPVWEEEFRFTHKSTDDLKITLHVKDEEQLGKDEWMGSVVVRLQDVINNQEPPAEKIYQIMKKGNPLKDSHGRPSTLTVMFSWTADPEDFSTASDLGAEWLNGALRKAVRLFNPMINQIATDSLVPILDGLEVPALKKLTLESFDIGQESPWMMQVELLPSRCDKDLQLKARLRWVTDSSMNIKIGVHTKLGITTTVSATALELEFPAWIQVRVQGKEPNLTLFQLAATEEPKLKFKLSLGGLSTSAIPGLVDLIDGIIRNVINGLLVPPNKLVCVQHDVALDASPLQKQAVGRLQVKILRGKGMVDPDSWGTCDPFVALSLGDQKFKTKTCYNTTEPVWNINADFLIVDEKSSILEIEVGDEDLMKTDSLGYLTLNVQDMVHQKGWRQQWHTLVKGKGAQVELALEYSKFVPDDGPMSVDASPDGEVAPDLESIVKKVEEAPSTGNLLIKVYSGVNLPKTDFFGSCDPYVGVECGSFYKKTSVIKNTLSPTWDDEPFVVENEKSRDVFFSLKDFNVAGKNETLGVIRVSLANLEPGGTIEGEFNVVRKNEKLCNGQGEPTKLKLMVKSVDPKAASAPPAPAPAPTIQEERPRAAAPVEEPASKAAAPPPEAQTVTLMIKVMRANDLPKMDMTGSTDGYVKVLLGEDKHTQKKTKTISRSLDPEWNESFAFTASSDSTEEINFKVYDKETFSKDDFIGMASVRVKDIVAGGPQIKSFTLVDKKQMTVVGKSGADSTLTVDLSWTSSV